MSDLKPAIVIDLKNAKDDYSPKPDHDPMGETQEQVYMTKHTCPICNSAGGLVGDGAFDARHMSSKQFGVEVPIICRSCASSGGYTDIQELTPEQKKQLMNDE